MFRNLFGANDKSKRTPRRRKPEVGVLEGRALLSAFHPHPFAARRAARLHRAMASHHATINTMRVTQMTPAATTTQTGTPTLTSPAPGEFGPYKPLPFAGYRPGGFVLHSLSVPSRSAPAFAAAQNDATTTPTGTPTLTSPAPGEFGPYKPLPFAGYRPGGYFLHSLRY